MAADEAAAFTRQSEGVHVEVEGQSRETARAALKGAALEAIAEGAPDGDERINAYCAAMREGKS